MHLDPASVVACNYVVVVSCFYYFSASQLNPRLIIGNVLNLCFIFVYLEIVENFLALLLLFTCGYLEVSGALIACVIFDFFMLQVYIL